MPKQRTSTSRGWDHPTHDGRGEKWCPRAMSDLGPMPFSLLIPKHVLRPRLVCTGPSSSAEMHYTKILTKAVLLCNPDLQWKETPGGVSPFLNLPHPLLVPWENKFIHGNIFLTGHFPSRNPEIMQLTNANTESVIISPAAAMDML